jgi:ATP-binding cassette subfamily F protein 3
MPMTVITITGVHKHYGANAVLDGAEATIADDQKLGVIGRNGAGKSTLCRLILGLEEPDAGRVALHADLRLAYLEQQAPFRSGETVLDFLMRWSGCEDWRCGKLAGRFLLKQDLLARPVASLSGGFQTRVKLAAMLLKEPNFLILDEPTNYLDLSTLLLLERFLSDFNGGYLVVSHDREFLRRTCRQTMEIAHGAITCFPGGIDDWLAYKAERRAQAEATNANLATRQRQLQEFVDRNRARASKASQAQSKLKLMDRLAEREVELPPPDPAVAIVIPPVEARQGVALRTTALAIGYPGRPVAERIEVELERSRHVAVLGDNGQGKTTFLDTIAGELPARGGAFRWGHGIRVGRYAQHVDLALDPALTVRDHLERASIASGAGVPRQQILDLAGGFLFRGDDVDKRVGVLSGGERARLCLAALLLGRHQVLLLDEPTNHLDFETVEALAEALAEYDGTILFTCHDRAFVARLATDVIEVRDGAVALYGGGYEAYLWHLEQEARPPGAEPDAAAKPPAGADDNATRRTRLDDFDRSRNRLKRVERRVAELDAEKKRLTLSLSATYDATQGERLAAASAELEAAETEWLELTQRIEALATALGRKASAP